MTWHRAVRICALNVCKVGASRLRDCPLIYWLETLKEWQQTVNSEDHFVDFGQFKMIKEDCVCS